MKEESVPDWQKYLDEWDRRNQPANFGVVEEGSRRAGGVLQDYFFPNFPESAEIPEEGQLAVDVFQDERNVYVLAPISGISPDDIDVSLENDVLTIKGKRDHAFREQGKNYLYQECYWGNFSRTLVLPVPVMEEGIEASFKKGVLTVVLPKKEVAEKVRISVVGGDE